MLKYIVGFLLALTFTLSLVHCSSSGKTSDVAKSSGDAAASGSWPVQMRSMAKNLDALMPYTYSQKEFNAVENRSKVRSLIANFEKSVGMVPQHSGEKMLGKDPLIRFAISRLKSNTRHAVHAFDENHVEFSRNILRENMGLCFSCHTTTDFGPENNFTTNKLSSSFRISPSERAEYYVATRQFDRAIDLLEGALKAPAGELEDPHEMVDSIKKYLSLQVRVKKDPAGAASLLENFLNNQKLPYFISVDVESWLKSLRDWQKERPIKAGGANARAQALLKTAKSKQASEGYQTAYVEYLRASALLHDGLREASTALQKSKVYENLGLCYEALSETGTWDLPEVYYEACVREAPKSATAQNCYKSYEKAIVLGFSGSAGIFIPKEEREKMAELKSLAGLATTK